MVQILNLQSLSAFIRGKYTTEFWTHLVVLAIAAGVSLIPATSPWAKIVALLVGGLSQVNYTTARKQLKLALLDGATKVVTPPPLLTEAEQAALGSTGSPQGAAAQAQSSPTSTLQPPSSNLLLLLLLPALMFFGSGCAALTAPTPAYVTGDQATYAAIAPRYSAYVAGDPTLDDATKAERLRTVATWKMRMDQASTSLSPGAGGASSQASTSLSPGKPGASSTQPAN